MIRQNRNSVVQGGTKSLRKMCVIWGFSGVLIIKIDYKSNLFPKRNTLHLLVYGSVTENPSCQLEIFSEQEISRRTGQEMKGMRKTRDSE